jgi:hypothetical protein
MAAFQNSPRRLLRSEAFFVARKASWNAGQVHLISSAIAEHFILRAHNQCMTSNHSVGLFLTPNP